MTIIKVSCATGAAIEAIENSPRNDWCNVSMRGIRHILNQPLVNHSPPSVYCSFSITCVALMAGGYPAAAQAYSAAIPHV